MDSAGRLALDCGNSVIEDIIIFIQRLDLNYEDGRRLEKSTPRVFINENNDHVPRAHSFFASAGHVNKIMTLTNRIFTILDTDYEIFYQ